MKDYQYKTTQITITYRRVYILVFMLNVTKHMHIVIKDLAIVLLTVNTAE